MILTATADLVAMIVATEVMAAVIVMMVTLPVESTAMPEAAMTAIVAVVVTTGVEAEVATQTAMTVVEIATVDAHLVMLLQQPPMATPLLAERLGSHMEVESTMKRDTPVVDIDR